MYDIGAGSPDVVIASSILDTLSVLVFDGVEVVFNGVVQFPDDVQAWPVDKVEVVIELVTGLNATLDDAVVLDLVVDAITVVVDAVTVVVDTELPS